MCPVITCDENGNPRKVFHLHFEALKLLINGVHNNSAFNIFAPKGEYLTN